MIKEFRGHQNFVNDMLFIENHKLVSGSADGFVKFWDYSTGECIHNFCPPSEKPNCDSDIYNLVSLTKENLSFLVCCKSHEIFLINDKGVIIKRFVNENKNVDFIAACTSIKHSYVYAMGNDNILYCFNIKTAKIEHSLKVAEKEVEILGMAHHPYKNLLIVYTFEGNIMFLAP